MTEPAPSLIRDTIFKDIKLEVLSCGLRPGAHIQEQQLVERYQVSKSPIRDALLRLEAEGLVEILPRKGYRIRPISISDAEEIYDMRQMLERECIARLIEKHDERAMQILNSFRKGPSSPDLVSWIEYNRAFHTSLAENCGSRRLAGMARVIIEHSQRLTCVSVTENAALRLDDFVAEHDALIEAIQAQDRRRAISLSRDHIESSRKRFNKALGNVQIVA
jgi:GntR family transcriptional regulator, rspAB operon transcriptional repressor